MTTPNLRQLLKKKGIGPTMSKTLNASELDHLFRHLTNPKENETTQLTMLTALYMLPKTDIEAQFIQQIHTRCGHLNGLGKAFLSNDPTPHPQLDLLFKLRNHEDLSVKEARTAAAYLLSDPANDPVKGAILEALRIKRESPEENWEIYDAIWQHSHRINVDVPILLDLSYAYDGFNRTPLLSPFIAVLLAEIGVPTYNHGTLEVAPKKGQTCAKVLEAAGINSKISPEHAKTALENPEIAWAYTDQCLITPALFKLATLRHDMVKRPVLATVEKIVSPLRAHKNYLVTGYTHPPYKEKMIGLIQRRAAWEKSLLIRGREGAPQCPEDRRCHIISISKHKRNESFIRPGNYALHEDKWSHQKDLSDAETLRLGLDALTDKNPDATKTLRYNCLVFVDKLGLFSPKEAAHKIDKAISSGAALARWNRGLEWYKNLNS